MRVRMLPVDRIRVINPRTRDKKKFDQIVENIALVGLKKPITVTKGKPSPDGADMYDLVCGQGRLPAQAIVAVPGWFTATDTKFPAEWVLNLSPALTLSCLKMRT